MTGDGDFQPNTAERLAADYPHADIYREFVDGNRHGDWIAVIPVTLRASTPDGLRALLVIATQLTQQHGPDEGRT